MEIGTSTIDYDTVIPPQDVISAINNRALALTAYSDGFYDFDGIHELTPTGIRAYIMGSYHDYLFYDKVLNEAHELNIGIHLNYSQVMLILHTEFGLDNLPFEVNRPENIQLDVNVTQMDDAEIISTKREGNIVKVIAQSLRRELDLWCEFDEYEVDKNGKYLLDDNGVYMPIKIHQSERTKITIQMEYTFKVNENGFPQLLSGRRLK